MSPVHVSSLLIVVPKLRAAPPHQCASLYVDSASAYFISKSLIELPLTLVQCLVQYALVYNMVGFRGAFHLMVLGK
jgi:hypothetical protein